MAEYNLIAVEKSLARAPALSSVLAMGTIPSAGSVPAGGFRPQTPLSCAQAMIEKEVSVPTAAGTIPAATATAEPLEEPEGLNDGSAAWITLPPREL